MAPAACRPRDAQAASPVQKDLCLLPSAVGSISASRGEMVRKAARSDLDALVRLGGRDAREPSRNTGGAAIGVADATRGSVCCRSAGRPAIIARAGSWGLPAVFVVRRRLLRKRTVQTPARRTGDIWVDRDAGTGTGHGGAATGPAWCYARVGFLPKRGTPGKNLLCRGQEPPAVWSVRRRMLRKRQAFTAAGSSRGCPLKGQSVPGGYRTCHRTPVWLGATSHDQRMVSTQGGLLPIRRPKVADGARCGAGCPLKGQSVPGGYSRRTPVGLGATRSRPGVQESR